MTGFWGVAMEQLINAVKNEKVSVILLFCMTAFVVFISWKGFLWADTEHGKLVTREEYQRDAKEIKTQIKELTYAFQEYTEETLIVNASQLVRDKQLTLQIAESTNASPTEIDRLKREIEAAKRYRSCLIAENPNCKHLKPPE